MPKICQGIVLNSQDYKEKDKLLTIFTLEYGKISAILKGCKNANAKLKFAFQPFCFAEFTIEDKGVVSQAELKESFFELSMDYDRYLIGCKMLNLINQISLENNSNPALFVNFLKTLNLLINYEKINEKTIFAKFLLSVLDTQGYKLNFNSCACCGGKMLTSYHYDFSIGGIVCVGCKRSYSMPISKETFVAVRGLTMVDFSNIANLKISESDLIIALNFLSAIFSQHFGKKFDFYAN